eukprot:UN03412
MSKSCNIIIIIFNASCQQTQQQQQQMICLLPPSPNSSYDMILISDHYAICTLHYNIGLLHPTLS